MKRKTFSFILLMGVFLVSMRAADKTSTWTGLWRIEQQSTDGHPVLYHFQISSADRTVTVFDSNWRQQRVAEVSMQADKLELTWEIGGRPIFGSMAAQGNQLGGTWALIHPQYQTTGNLVGRKVLPQQGWQPFNGFFEIQAANGMIDFSGYLINNSPLDDYDTFVRFWNAEVEPGFYPAVCELVYGAGNFQPGLKEKQLSSLYATLKDGDFKARSKKIGALYPGVQSDLRKRFPRLNLKAAPIAMPPLEGMSSGVRGLGSLTFVFVDVSTTGRFPDIRIQHLLARDILKGSVLTRFDGEDLALKVLLSGLLTELTRQLNYSDRRTDHFLVSEESIVEVEQNQEKYRAQLSKLLRSGSFRDKEAFFEQAPHPGHVLSHQFVRALLGKKPLDEVLEMELHEFYTELRAYLSSGQ